MHGEVAMSVVYVLGQRRQCLTNRDPMSASGSVPQGRHNDTPGASRSHTAQQLRLLGVELGLAD